jgi:hypothetical protein
MSLTAEDRPTMVTPHSLLGRTAKAMYDSIWTEGDEPYFSLSHGQRAVYESMAAAALTVALMEPATT